MSDNCSAPLTFSGALLFLGAKIQLDQLLNLQKAIDRDYEHDDDQQKNYYRRASLGHSSEIGAYNRSGIGLKSYANELLHALSV
jgi:hypothetical protein